MLWPSFSSCFYSVGTGEWAVAADQPFFVLLVANLDLGAAVNYDLARALLTVVADCNSGPSLLTLGRARHCRYLHLGMYLRRWHAARAVGFRVKVIIGV